MWWGRPRGETRAGLRSLGPDLSELLDRVDRLLYRKRLFLKL